MDMVHFDKRTKRTTVEHAQGSLLFNVSTKTIQTRKVFKKKHTCGLLFAKLSYTFA